MAHFITLTLYSGIKVRVNFDRMLSYYPNPQDEGGGRGLINGSDVVPDSADRPVIWVRESPEEIDRLLNPAHTP